MNKWPSGCRRRRRRRRRAALVSLPTRRAIVLYRYNIPQYVIHTAEVKVDGCVMLLLFALRTIVFDRVEAAREKGGRRRSKTEGDKGAT